MLARAEHSILAGNKLKFVAVSFPRFSSVLTAFEGKFLEFKNGLNKDLQMILPQIRGGGSQQTELTDLVNRYRH